jgi:hypothetical protein
MISKMIDETIRYQAKKEGTSYEAFSEHLLEKGKKSNARD